MRRCLIIIILLAGCFVASAQDIVTPVRDIADPQQPSDTTTVKADTLYCNMEVIVDTLYAGQSIFDNMPSRSRGDAGTVRVHQSYAIMTALREKVASATLDGRPGFRVRIFFSNAQNAREASMTAAATFGSKFPGHNIYRSFVNPNFKITVGDFRTRSEALKLLNALKFDFPGAFVVRENIHYAY